MTPAKSLEDIPLITELNPQQTKGLNQLAKILKVTPDYLLQHTLIEQFDLVE